MPDPAVELDVGNYVYAVVPAAGTVSGIRGVDDTTVEFVTHEGLAAAVSRIELDRPPGRRAELMAHQSVVELLANEGPVVPIRFGSVLPDGDDAVRDLLEEEGDRFAAVLDQLVDRVQLNLRATYVEEQVLAEVVAEEPEIAELRRRTRDLPEGTMHPDLVRLGEAVAHAMEVRRTGDAAALLDEVLPLVQDHRERPGGGVDHLLDVALLVQTEAVPGVEGLLESLAEAWHERVRMQLVGPVAPYDFAEADTWA